jgi:hypothetical protein
VLLVGFLDEGMEIDPRLVAKWFSFPILNVALVQAASCDEVQDI